MFSFQETLVDPSLPLNILVRCAEAKSQRTIQLLPPIDSSHYILDQALPSCTYAILVTSAQRMTSCMVMALNGSGNYEMGHQGIL
jgi:hypothetical protein